MNLTSFFAVLMCLIFASARAGLTAPYAAIVIDAKTNNILQEHNSDLVLHPAGLTKLITLYVTLDAIHNGEIKLTDKVKISENAASEPQVKLGLTTGSQIDVKYLLRAAAVLGANDAATALAESISGSEDAFVRQLKVKSLELGLTSSSWKNAHGLTEIGHFSTAKDISLLVMAHKRDFPEYFNMFSRSTTDAGIANVVSSSRRILSTIEGVEAARFGHTRAAGYNAAVYVTRGNRSLVVVVFGATSTRGLLDKLDALIQSNI